MTDISKEALVKQLKTNKPQVKEVIANYITDENIKAPAMHFVEWLSASSSPPSWMDLDEQHAIAWEVQYKGKKHFIVYNGNDLSIMVKASFTSEYQAIISANNMQNKVMDNLQYCSRASGGQCSGCSLPADVAGVDEVLFGKEIKNLCCGQFITFDNPNSEAIAGIKKLLEY